MRIEAAAQPVLPIRRPGANQSLQPGTHDVGTQASVAPERDRANLLAASGASGEQSGSERGKQLSREEQNKVADLKRRDIEVRSHERAHLGAAGGLARGGASFSYETGPDGKRYAVGGEVSIDTSAESGDPAATVQKMRKVQRAALAPADPSSQDRAVAAGAARKAAQAQQELNHENREKGSLVDLSA